jgi:hypothetical protein
MRLQYILPAAAALTALVGPVSAASVSSTFDTDAEGWGVGNIRSNFSTAPDPSNPPTYNATGGNPGCYISTTDTEDIVAFLAPGKFLGDDSAFLGGKLTFDLQDLVPPDDAACRRAVHVDRLHQLHIDIAGHNLDLIFHSAHCGRVDRLSGWRKQWDHSGH